MKQPLPTIEAAPPHAESCRAVMAGSPPGPTPHGPHRTPALFVRLAPGAARTPEGATINSHKPPTTAELLYTGRANRGLHHFQRRVPAYPFFCRLSCANRPPSAKIWVDVGSHNSCFTVAFSVAPPGFISLFLSHGEGGDHPLSCRRPSSCCPPSASRAGTATGIAVGAHRRGPLDPMDRRVAMNLHIKNPFRPRLPRPRAAVELCRDKG